MAEMRSPVSTVPSIMLTALYSYLISRRSSPKMVIKSTIPTTSTQTFFAIGIAFAATDSWV